MNFLNAIFASFIVSLISLIGLTTLGLKRKFLNKILIYFVGFSTGAMFGDVFIHLLPEFYESGIDYRIGGLYILSGIITFFIIEKIIHWNHCHSDMCEVHNHKLAKINLIGDIFHNLIDGIIIGSSFMVDYRLGVATTIAIIFHEIPQEIGDFGILLHSGLSIKKAIYYNFLTACGAIIGVALPYLLSNKIENINNFLIPFAAGTFIYIAGSDLIPELHKKTSYKSSILQLISIIVGISIMYSILIIG